MQGLLINRECEQKFSITSFFHFPVLEGQKNTQFHVNHSEVHNTLILHLYVG